MLVVGSVKTYLRATRQVGAKRAIHSGGAERNELEKDALVKPLKSPRAMQSLFTRAKDATAAKPCQPQKRAYISARLDW